MKRININDIDFSLSYEGYYWYSNSSNPILASNVTSQIFTDLPFIVEGNFYSKEKGVSISIKYIDGSYFIFQAELNDLSKDQCTINEYIAHKLEGIKKIRVIQYWKEEADPLLEGMKTLIPSWQAFKGFVK